MELEKLFDDGGELGREKLVSFVHDEHGAFTQIRHLLSSQIEDSARGADHNMDGVLETDNVIAEACATSGNHDVDAEVLSKRLANLGCLHGEFSGRDQDKTLDLVDFGVDLLESGDDEGSCFAGSVLGARKNITPGERNWNAFFLDGRGLLETSFENAHQ